ncbi:MAG: hypothetical protein J2P30_17695 [Actinobacteria bacterium]|nr:hypothetical protein [Actinomycetota bacterium]
MRRRQRETYRPPAGPACRAAIPAAAWYGMKRGLRGRFGNYVPPVLEALGLAEVEHNARNNRMRAR